MPSSYTPNLRFEQQYTGENINIWGVLLNLVIALIDKSITGLSSIALTGNYTLTTANGTDDQARNAILKFSGTGTFAVTIPSVSKVYIVWNTCTGPVTLTTGAGTTASVLANEIMLVVSDGSNVRRVFSQDMGGARLQNVGSPVAATDAATKGDVDAAKLYADTLAWTYNAGNLPGQSGHSGEFLKTVDSVAGWAAMTIADITDYASDQATKIALAKGRRRLHGTLL